LLYRAETGIKLFSIAQIKPTLPGEWESVNEYLTLQKPTFFLWFRLTVDLTVSNLMFTKKLSRCQAKFLTSAKFLTYYFLLVILLLRAKG